jgi:serine protease AprX
VLNGERDIFGDPVSTSTLASKRDAGTAWTGGTWNGRMWSAGTWTGRMWSGDGWSGNTWSSAGWN